MAHHAGLGGAGRAGALAAAGACRVALAALLCTLTTTAAVAAEDGGPLVALPAGVSVELAMQAAAPPSPPLGEGGAWVPAVVQPGATAPLGALVTDVALGAVHDPAWLRRFAVTFDVASDTRGPGLAIRVSAGPSLAQGTYQVAVRLSDAADPAVVQPLTLLVTHPAATLRGPERLRVERRVWPAGETRSPFPLAETSGEAAAVVTLQAPGVPQHDGQPVEEGVGLELPTAPVEVAAGGRAEVTYGVVGDLPLGDVTGTVEVRAPQLASPLEIPFTIATRLSSGWLVGALVVGLLAGHVMRHVIDVRISSGEAKQPALTLLGRLEEEIERATDDAYSRALSQAYSELLRAVEQQPVTALPDAVKTASDAFAAARKTWKDDLARARTEVDAFRDVVERTWVLPSPLPELRSEQLPGVREAAERLASGDAGGARDRVQRAGRSLAQSARGPGRAWRLAQEQEWARVVHELGEAPAWLAAPVAASRQAVDDALAALDWSAPEPDLAALFAAHHTAHYALLNAQESLRRQARTLGRSLLRTLRAASARDRAGVEEVEERLAALEPSPPGSGADPLAMGRILDDLKALEDALVRAFERALEQHRLPDERDRAVREALRAHDLEGAAVALVAPPARKAGRRFAVSVAPPPSPAGIAPAATRGPAPSVLPPIGPGFQAGLIEKHLGPMHRAKLARTLILGVPIVGLGYVLLAADFLGTLTQLVTAFLWAYGIDVTTDALVEIGKPLVSKIGK